MRLLLFCFIISKLLFLIGCISQNPVIPTEVKPEKKPQRYGMVTGIKPEKIAYYKKLHAETWEGVLKKIKECNIRNYSIYLKQIGENFYLFSYYEYIGNDYKKDMEKIAADTTTQRWWKETDPCQSPLPEAASVGKIWTEMEEVFHSE